jgi:hypothetical protein
MLGGTQLHAAAGSSRTPKLGVVYMLCEVLESIWPAALGQVDTARVLE